jgi:hypothetical protein
VNQTGTRRPSWLLLLTLLGLTGCALVAALHPVEHFDPARSIEQTGRHLQVHLEVTTSRSSDTWARGEALALNPQGHPYPAPVSWVWFRAGEAPQSGDRIQGRALLTQDGASSALLLDGPRAATVEPGPLPIPVHWSLLLEHPQVLTGRLLMVNGHIDGDRLRSPSDDASCPLVGTHDNTDSDRWLLRLEREPRQPGWACRLEGPV